MAPLCHAEKFLSIPRAFLMKELHIPDRGLLSAFFTARYFVVVTGVGSWFMLPTSRVKGLGKCQRVFFSRERRQSCPPPPHARAASPPPPMGPGPWCSCPLPLRPNSPIRTPPNTRLHPTAPTPAARRAPTLPTGASSRSKAWSSRPMTPEADAHRLGAGGPPVSVPRLI